MKDLKEGFYHLYNENESEPVLVHGYKCTDLGDKFGFGFNTHDGGGFLPLSDLIESSRVVLVEVIPFIEPGRNSDCTK